MRTAVSPTLALYSRLETAFQHFNRTLFDARLPACLITLRSEAAVYAYHHGGRFINLQGETLDEIGLHPGHFALRSVETVLSTLVHEMVHHWQHHFGSPSVRLAHNTEWSRKMQALGLIPSHTGLPEGRKTGQRMSHYIDPHGPFLTACQGLLADGFDLEWYDREIPTAPEHEAKLQTRLAAAGVCPALSPVPLTALKDWLRQD